jgi:hypothetical protein
MPQNFGKHDGVQLRLCLIGSGSRTSLTASVQQPNFTQQYSTVRLDIEVS